MNFSLSTLIILFAALLSACETAPDSTTSGIQQPAAAEGVITGYEDGYLTLRMPSGRTQDFLDSDAGIVPWRDNIIGKRCRVFFKEGVHVVGGGVATIPALQITRFELL